MCPPEPTQKDRDRAISIRDEWWKDGDYDSLEDVIAQAIASTRAETEREIIKSLRGWRESDPPEYLTIDEWKVLGLAKEMIADELQRRSGSYKEKTAPPDAKEQANG